MPSHIGLQYLADHIFCHRTSLHIIADVAISDKGKWYYF